MKPSLPTSPTLSGRSTKSSTSRSTPCKSKKKKLKANVEWESGSPEWQTLSKLWDMPMEVLASQVYFQRSCLDSCAKLTAQALCLQKSWAHFLYTIATNILLESSSQNSMKLPKNSSPPMESVIPTCYPLPYFCRYPRYT